MNRICRQCEENEIPPKRIGRGRNVEICKLCKRENAQKINNNWYALNKHTMKYREAKVRNKNKKMKSKRNLAEYVNKVATYVEEHEAAVEDQLRYE